MIVQIILAIAAYVLAEAVRSFIANSLKNHLGQKCDSIFGVLYSTLVEGVLILLIEWWILYWMYKKKIFIKI